MSIANYKNIGEARLAFSPKLNCFIGHNGEGKTNLLDAVYYLSFCRSASPVPDSNVIRHDSDYFMLDGAYIGDDGTEERVTCGMKRGMKKRFRRNKKEYKRLSAHIGLIPLILVSPSDSAVIDGGSEGRRRLMDVVISQCDAGYMEALGRYNKALQQRNSLLKAGVAADGDLMALWEERMAVEGEALSGKRDAFIAEIEPLFQRFYRSISQGREHVSLRYVSHCQRGRLLDVIRDGRSKDYAVGYSLHGVHRDDLEMMIGDNPIRREGSQGQNKTFVISLKLAQFEYLKCRRRDVRPILLLDDIFDKLDACRVEQIVKIVGGEGFGQIFLTDTNRGHLDSILRGSSLEYKLFYVEGGVVRQEEDGNV